MHYTTFLCGIHFVSKGFKDYFHNATKISREFIYPNKSKNSKIMKIGTHQVQLKKYNFISYKLQLYQKQYRQYFKSSRETFKIVYLYLK